MTKPTLKSTTILIAASLSTFLISCGKETDADKIADAQACLDKATSDSQIDSCKSKVEGLTSQGAESIRCSSSFLKEGFTSPSYIADVLEELDSGGGGVKRFMGLVTFKKGGNLTADLSNAEKTFNYCLNAEGKGALIISSFGFVATSLYNFFANLLTVSNAACDTTPDSLTGYPLEGCITYVTSGGANVNTTRLAALSDPNTVDSVAVSTQTAVGSALVTTYNISCKSSSSNDALCNSLKSAIDSAGGTSNQRRVATEFITDALIP